MNPLSIAMNGVGFTALSIALLGFVHGVEVAPPSVIQSGGGGGYAASAASNTSIKRHLEDLDHLFFQQLKDEDDMILMVVTQLTTLGAFG